MTVLPVAALLAGALWLCLAALLPRLPMDWAVRARWGLVGMGVPTVGWITLLWGPGIGVGGLALGLLALLDRPARRTGDAPLPAGRTSSDGPT
jgi:hypothetical protein